MLGYSHQCTLDELFEQVGFTVFQYRQIYHFFSGTYNRRGLSDIRTKNYFYQIVKGSNLEYHWEKYVSEELLDGAKLHSVIEIVLRNYIGVNRRDEWNKYSYGIIKLLQLYGEHLQLWCPDSKKINEIRQFIESLNLTPAQIADLERK